MDQNLKKCYFCKSTLPNNCESFKEFPDCVHKLFYCKKCLIKTLDLSDCPLCSIPVSQNGNEDESPEFTGDNQLLFVSLNSYSLNIPLLILDPNQNIYQGPYFLRPNELDSQPFIPSFYPAILQVGPSSFIISGGIITELVQSLPTNKVRINNEILCFTILKEKNLTYEVTKRKSMKNGRYSHNIFQIGEKLILVGGFTDIIGNFSKSTEILDENWESKVGPQLNVARTQFQGFLLGSYLYVFGGLSAEEKVERSFERLNINDLQIWENFNFKNQEIISGWCSSFIFSNSKNEIYIVGGYDGTRKKEKKENILKINDDQVINLGKTEFGEINGSGVTPDQEFIFYSVNYKFHLETRNSDNFEYLGSQGIDIVEIGGWQFNTQEKWFIIC